MEQENNRTLMS